MFIFVPKEPRQSPKVSLSLNLRVNQSPAASQNLLKVRNQAIKEEYMKYQASTPESSFYLKIHFLT